MSGGIEEIMLGLAKHLKIQKKQYNIYHTQQQHLRLVQEKGTGGYFGEKVFL